MASWIFHGGQFYAKHGCGTQHGARGRGSAAPSNMIKIRGRTAIRAGETHLEVMCDLNVYLSVTLTYICM